MKKTRKRMKQVIIMMMVLAILMPISAYGQTQTVEVKGYLWEGMSDEAIAETPAHFSVSNVAGTLDAIEENFDVDAALIAQSSAVVTTLTDGVVFDVYKLSEKDDGTYEYFMGEELPVLGQISFSIPDPSGELEENGLPKYIFQTVDSFKMADYDVDGLIHYSPGCTVTLTEPGDYYVIFRVEAIAGAAEAFIRVTDEPIDEPIGEPTEAAKPAEVVTAKVTSSKVLVDGNDILFDAYNINGNNYFKLRDLAMVVSGTTKQFEVTWDGEKNAINLVSGESYTEVGGELAKGDGKDKTGSLNTAKIYKDGEEIQLVAYNIDGNNYFKLRDIAGAFNIGVTWNEITSTVGIDTSMDYVEE